MDSTLSIITMNCRGLGNAQKRKDVLNYLKSKHYDICCLQDTHFISDFEDSIGKNGTQVVIFLITPRVQEVCQFCLMILSMLMLEE